MQPLIVGVRFAPIGKVYHFDASALPEIKTGDHVIVDTSRGRQLGEVTQIVKNPPPPQEGGWKAIERIATPRDLVLRRTWAQKELEAMLVCRERAIQLKLDGVKVVAAEYSFDGTRLTFMFSTETEEKVDLKSLRHDMQKQYGPSQVEMRQIGPRDVAKILGGLGACGMERRCCSRFLTDFSPISIKMAKEQGISLTPTEITGMCGRLRCCLVYEYEQYVAARKELPKRNKQMVTPLGQGRVVDVSPLRMTVYIELPDVGVREFPLADIQPLEEWEALKQKAAEPCDNCENKEPQPQIVPPENKATQPQPQPRQQERRPQERRPQERRPAQSRPGPQENKGPQPQANRRPPRKHRPRRPNPNQNQNPK